MIDTSVLTSITQGGLAAVGVFGLYHGYSLYSQQINKEPPKDEIALNAHNSNHQAIKLFLFTSLSVTILTGGIEILKLFYNPKNSITIKISPYHQVDQALRPSINLKSIPLTVSNGGVIEASVENKDAIYVEIGQLTEELKTYISRLEAANRQIGDSTKNSNGTEQELGNEPNI